MTPVSTANLAADSLDRPWDSRAAGLFLRLVGHPLRVCEDRGVVVPDEHYRPDRDSHFQAVRYEADWPARLRWRKLLLVLRVNYGVDASADLGRFWAGPIPTTDLEAAALHQLMLEQGVEALPHDLASGR